MVAALRRMIEESHTLPVDAAVNQRKRVIFFFLVFFHHPHLPANCSARARAVCTVLSAVRLSHLRRVVLFGRVKWV